MTTAPELLLGGALLLPAWAWRRRWPGRHRHARVAGRLLVLFGAAALACLMVIGRGGAQWRFPPEFADARRLVAVTTGLPAPLALPVFTMIAAIGAGGVIAGLVARVRRRAPVTLGDVSALVPRTLGEIGWGVILALVAGVAEELYFRLALPLVVAIATGSAVAGFALSAGLFGWAHRYQGTAGMAATLVLGALLSVVYLLTGALWVVIVLHVALDVNALVVRPVVAGLGSRSSGG